MKKINIILVALISSLFVSCDDYVDITPKGNAIATSMDDVNKLLNYSTVMSSYWGNNNAVPSLINDNVKMVQADIDQLYGRESTAYYGNIYQLNNEFFLSNEDDVVWSTHYSTIGHTNYIIKVLGEIEGEQAIKDQYWAEAATHRAYAYFRLVNVFGHQYGLPQASEDGSGVPIVLDYANAEESLERKSVNEVYELIVNDLKMAIPLLQIERPTKDRINKAAAEALLARVYFQMGKYNGEESGQTYTTRALSYNSELIDYNSLEAGEAPPHAFKENPENILMKEVTILATGSYPNYKGIGGTFSDELVDMYADKVNDLRISRVAVIDENADYVYALQNYRDYRHVIGVNVPELMLMKAECLARDGQTADAMDVVNALRAKRFESSFVDADLHKLTATDQTDALRIIQEEKRREFHVMGVRFFDIKRLNALHDANISLTRGSVTWEPNSINWAVPIGENVIENGKGEIKQNPRE